MKFEMEIYSLAILIHVAQVILFKYQNQNQVHISVPENVDSQKDWQEGKKNRDP